MVRNTAGVKNPVSNEEFDRIVAKGEARLGKQFFFGGNSEVVAPVQKVIEAPKVEAPVHHARRPVETFLDDVSNDNPYGDVFLAALLQIKDIKGYEGSR